MSITPEKASVKTEEVMTPRSVTPTPKSKKRVAKVGNDGTPGSNKKSKTAVTTPASKKTIPTSAENLSEEDKMLLKMRDEDNAPWPLINAAWQEATNTTVNKAYASIRYKRLKAALARIKDSDHDALREAKTSVETQIEEEKKALDKKLWSRIAEAMESAGTEKYDAATVEKEWKRMAGGAATAGADADLDDE